MDSHFHGAVFIQVKWWMNGGLGRNGWCAVGVGRCSWWRLGRRWVRVVISKWYIGLNGTRMGAHRCGCRWSEVGMGGYE